MTFIWQLLLNLTDKILTIGNTDLLADGIPRVWNEERIFYRGSYEIKRVKKGKIDFIVEIRYEWDSRGIEL